METNYRMEARHTMTPETKIPFIPPFLAHNMALCKTFLDKHGIKSQWPPVTEQAETFVIHGLPTGSYNPSIIRFRGRLVMAYRYHPVDGNARTTIGIAELGEDLKVVSVETPDLNEDEGMSLEDPRLFIFKGDLWMNYVVSTWPNFPSSQSRNIKLSKPDHWRTSDKDTYWLPDRQTMEKNHVPFVHDEVLHMIWKSNLRDTNAGEKEAWQVIYTPTDKREMKSLAMQWPYGEIHGGTTPLPYDGKLISFFHSKIMNDMPPTPWRYFVGCVLRRAIPPFDILAVSKRPILIGSEVGGDASRHHFKKSVVFPAGCVEHEGSFVLSIGINDSSCAVVKLAKKDLRL